MSETTKSCSRCELQLPVERFRHSLGTADGYERHCIDCTTAVPKPKCRKKAAKKAVKTRWGQDKPKTPAQRKAARQDYYQRNRDDILAKARKRREQNPEATREAQKAWYSKNWKRNMVTKAKARAKKQGVLFDITVDDLEFPDVCPVLGCAMSPGHSDRNFRPSLDKIIPELGYTPENSRVISYRANRIKNDGTLEEHQRIAEYMHNHIHGILDT